MDLTNIQDMVTDTTSAISELVSRSADGTLAELDPAEAATLSSRAGRSVLVASEAFGVDPGYGDTPQGVTAALFDEYARQRVSYIRDSVCNRADRQQDERMRHNWDSIVSYLGLTPNEVTRIDIDAQAGDTSPLTSVYEKFVFG